jgi:hypothetical protein
MRAIGGGGGETRESQGRQAAGFLSWDPITDTKPYRERA